MATAQCTGSGDHAGVWDHADAGVWKTSVFF